MALSARPGLHLADFVIALAPSGNAAPMTGTIIRATPSVIPLFVQQADSSYVPAAQPTQTVTVAGDGSWSLVLPAQSDCQPTTVTWTLTLPDGSSYSGIVTDAMVTASQSVPLTVHDLTATYAWGMVVSAVTPVVTLQGAKGDPGTGVQITGAYNSALQYVANDVVSVTALDDTVSTYYATGTVPPATPPPNNTYWAAFVSAGPPGENGSTVDATTSTVGGALINRAPPGAHPIVPVLTGGGVVNDADLPVPTHTTRGGAKVGNSLSVDGTGVLDILQEVSILRYGDGVGLGNHVADEAAFDAWMADTAHRVLFLPEGNYYLAKAYNLGNRAIRGAGMGRTFIHCTAQLGAVNAITAGFTGTFKLIMSDTSHVPYTTQAIAVIATAAEVQTALAALVCVPDPADISVTGPDGGPWQVTYQGNLAATAFDPLVVVNRNANTPPTGYALGPYVATSLVPVGDTTHRTGSRPEVHSYLAQKGGTYNSTPYNQVETLQAANTPVPFLQLADDTNSSGSPLQAYLYDLSIFGPSPGITTGNPPSGAVGQKMAHVDGLLLGGKCELSRVAVGGFDYGLLIANFFGHTICRSVTSSGNYYGVYDIFDGGDVYFEGCQFDSNYMAAFGIGPDNSNGLQAALLNRCHLGGAPYAFYGEYRGTAWQMLAQVQLHNSPFEAVGNAAIYSEGWDVTTDPTKLRPIQDVMIERSGFYFAGATQRLPSSRADKNYCFKVGAIVGTCRIVDDWVAPFIAGDIGTWYIAANDQGQTDIYSGGPNYSNGSVGTNNGGTGSGTYTDSTAIYKVGDHDVSGVVPPRFYLHRNNASSEGTGTITAGTTFVDISAAVIQPEKTFPFLGYNCHPVVTPTSDPTIGSVAGTPFTLLVTNLSSIPGIKTGNLATASAGTSFRVSVLGGTPTVDLTLYWRIR
jgi:hypothetical protein